MHENKHKTDLEEIMQKDLTDYYDELLKDPVACQFSSEQEAQIFWRNKVDNTIYKYWEKVKIDFKILSGFLNKDGEPYESEEEKEQARQKYENETQKLVRDYINNYYRKTALHSRGCS